MVVWYERAAGIDFTQPVSVEVLQLDPARSVKYSPSDNRHLRRVLNLLDILPEHKMLDLGCGKGSAIRLMLKYPFARVDGVELSDTLVGIARRNFARLEVTPSRCRIFSADAARFDALDEYSHVYFYNPFHCEVMRVVLANIHTSLDRTPRKVTIIYYNAVCASEITSGGRFRVNLETRDEEGNLIMVFSNQPE